MGERALRLVIGGWLLLAASVQAAAPLRLSLRVTACPTAALRANELERSLRAELEADALVVLADRNADAELVADVACDDALSTSIRLASLRTRRHRERRIVLADAKPSARAGVLALAAAELVRSDLSELTSTEPSRADYPSEAGNATTAPAKPAASTRQQPSPQPTAAADKPEAPPAAPLQPQLASPAADRDRSPRVPRRSWTISADARLRWFLDYGSLSWGGAAGADLGAWRLRAEALLSAPHDSLGSASLGSAAAVVGYRVLDQRLGALQLSLFPQVAAGATWMRGATSEPDVHVSPATGIYADARLVAEARLETAALAPTLALELGRATGYVARSSGRALGATGGFFIGASAGGAY